MAAAGLERNSRKNSFQLFSSSSSKETTLISTSWHKNKEGVRVRESECVGCACVRVSVWEHLVINSMHNTFVYSSISLSLSQKLNPTSQKFSSARTFWCKLLSFSFSFSSSLCLSHFYLSIFWHKSEKFPDVELQSVWAEASCGTLLGDNVITFSQGQRDKC